MKFNELELIEPLIEAVNQMNYKEASPIQQQAIPVLLEGHDLFGCAKREKQLLLHYLFYKSYI